MVVGQQLVHGRILHFDPFIHSLIALRFHHPHTAVVTLDERPAAAGVGSPEPSTGPVEVVEPCEHGFLDFVYGQTLNRIFPEEINSSEVVKLHGQVHVRRVVNHVGAGHMSGTD